VKTRSPHSFSLSSSPVPTVLGIVSILIWSSLIAVSRDLAEQVGTFRAAAAAYAISGALSATILLVRHGALRKTLRSPPAYLLGCGFLYLTHMIGLAVAVGLAETRAQVLGVGLINYLWPSLTVLFAVAVLRARVTWALLLPGLALAFAGAVLAVGWAGGLSIQGFLAAAQRGPIPFVLAVVTATSWAAYSNLSRRWAPSTQTSGVPLFVIATAIALATIQWLIPSEPPPQWSLDVCLRLLYVGILPNCIAYFMWDIAMRRGRILLVAVLSNLIPLFSTLISCILLDLRMGWPLWLACALVVGGAWICRRSFRMHPGGQPNASGGNT